VREPREATTNHLEWVQQATRASASILEKAGDKGGAGLTRELVGKQRRTSRRIKGCDYMWARLGAFFSFVA
jgi:hypothetical protein